MADATTEAPATAQDPAPPAAAKPTAPKPGAKPRKPRKRRAAAPVPGDVVPAAHNKAAIVRAHGGGVAWVDAAEAKRLVDAGEARRATAMDLKIAGAPATPPGFPAN